MQDLSGDAYIPSYSFEVRLGLVIKINFAQISNIASQKEFDIIADGGNTDRMYFGEKPKRKPDTITFSRGLTVGGYDDMLSWLVEGLKVDGIMILVKKDRTTARIFYIEQGILTKISFSDLDAASSRIMIKTMEMQHTGVMEFPV